MYLEKYLPFLRSPIDGSELVYENDNLIDASKNIFPSEIEFALKKMLVDHDLRKNISISSFKYSKKFNWSKCADQTFLFLQRTLKKSTDYLKNPNQANVET